MHSPIAKCWLVGLTLLLLAGSASGRDPTLPAFALSRDGQPAGYLVGTMHTEDPRVMALLETLEPLLREVDVLAVELVPDGVTMLAVAAATLLPADQRLSGQIGLERFAALREAAALRGLPETLLERLKPWAAAVALGVPAAESGQVLDTALYLSAQTHGRRVVGLETAAEQVGVFDRMPIDLQILLLDAMVKNAERMPMHIEELTAAYLSGDLGRIDRVARDQYADVPPVLRAWFEQELLQDRNVRMLTRSLHILDRERVLIAVGAMHLGGPDGLVGALRASGFVVTPLPGS